ncbi:MAG: LysE/ArgO family amino acid transporter [Propionibacteriaceae bacterium]|nr:LysE/ArgO family amino acid transporter [Propionibacteriaceae bacterium]
MIAAAAAGLGAGLSLIIAIGAQNAFVLRNGLRGTHVGWIVAVCAASDIILISVGTGALGWISSIANPALVVMRWGGVAFLVVYGFLSLRRAWRGETLGVEGDDAVTTRLWPTLVTTLALTWLNPHVYVDTVLLLGSLANSHRPGQWWFAGGAMLASCLWFPLLGFGARWLRPLFRSARAWRVLDVIIALVMWGIAASLVWRG